MNKKILGIAAVALLGVSAAFAATTSTVYFTASGTLTKYDAPSFGLYSVYTIDREASLPDYVCNGEETSLDNIKCTLLDDGRVENTKTVSGYTNDYLYTKCEISGLNFSKKDDYCFISLAFLNNDDNAYSFAYDVVRKITVSNYDGEIVTGYSLATVEGTKASKFSVKISNFTPLLVNDSFSTFTYTDSNGTTTYTMKESLESKSESCTLPSKSFYYMTMSIQLNEDITSETAGDFSLNITLPEFTRAE